MHVLLSVCDAFEQLCTSRPCGSHHCSSVSFELFVLQWAEQLQLQTYSLSDSPLHFLNNMICCLWVFSSEPDPLSDSLALFRMQSKALVTSLCWRLIVHLSGSFIVRFVCSLSADHTRVQCSVFGQVCTMRKPFTFHINRPYFSISFLLESSLKVSVHAVIVAASEKQNSSLSE